MKRIIIAFTALLLLFAACKEKYDCKMDHPKDLKPIDWENYNDVYTVYWNFFCFCSKVKENPLNREIMVCGWIFQGVEGKYPFDNLYFTLISNEEDIFWWNCSTRGKGVVIRPYCKDSNGNFIDPRDSLRIKFDTTDITKKCFIKGRLGFECLNTDGCSMAVPEIILEDINNIYFEK